MNYPVLKRQRHLFNKAGRALALVALLLGLGACSTIGDFTDRYTNPITLKCPDYRVIADAANLVKFKDGPGRDLIDVNFEGSIVGVDLVCTSDVDQKTKNGTLEVAVNLRVEASRGPANRDRKARFEFFVRVLDPNRKTLKGENIATVINFPGNKTRVQFLTQPVTMILPITEKWRPRYYRFFTGFKPTRQELEFNREKIRNDAGRPSR